MTGESNVIGLSGYQMDVQLGPNGHLLQTNCNVHLSRQAQIIERICIANAFVGARSEVRSVHHILCLTGNLTIYAEIVNPLKCFFVRGENDREVSPWRNGNTFAHSPFFLRFRRHP